MINDRLTAFDRELAYSCLIAAADGPFFGDFEYLSLMGLTREETRQVAECLRDGKPSSFDLSCVVGAALNNLLRFPHRQDHELTEWVPGGRTAVVRMESRWHELRSSADKSLDL